jgi:hypothetical protein
MRSAAVWDLRGLAVCRRFSLGDLRAEKVNTAWYTFVLIGISIYSAACGEPVDD